MYRILCVYDSKAMSYGQPIFQKTIGEAIRTFTEVANQSDSLIGKYPDDFTLFEVGTFDEQQCKFVIHPQPHFINKAGELVKRSLVSNSNEIDRSLPKSLKV